MIDGNCDLKNDEELDPYSNWDDANWPESISFVERARPVVVWFAIIIAVIILLFVTGRFVIRGITAIAGNDTIYIVGPYVDHLSEETSVVLDNDIVGRVKKVKFQNGRIAATLRIDRKVLRKLPSDSVFRIISLNKWMPGNLGVRIVIPQSSSGSFKPIESGATITVGNTVLPPLIPPRFWLVVAACFAILIIILVCSKLLKTIFTFIKLIHGFAVAAIAIIILITYLNNMISL